MLYIEGRHLGTVKAVGDKNALFRVYMGNHPNYCWNHTENAIKPLNSYEILQIGKACGNGWRKIFNVYAKLIYALDSNCIGCTEHYTSWQEYRDKALLQENSDTLLCFSNHSLEDDIKANVRAVGAIKLVMGRTYAKSLHLPTLHWFNSEFAIDPENKIIICPYFDYRQLSNQKIIYLVDTIKTNFLASK